MKINVKASSSKDIFLEKSDSEIKFDDKIGDGYIPVFLLRIF